MPKEGGTNHLLSRNVEQVIDKAHLESSLRSDKKLRVKLGIDPTSPDLHLGHAVVLRKLREFQDLGHRAVLIIGDFTAQIGDPSGRSEARKPLTEVEIKKNMQQYLVQAGKIIDVKKLEVRKNSEWHKKNGLSALLELARSATVQQILKREDFEKRMKEDKEISMLETLYPLLQGYDSVAVKADVELGGTDQLFNLLMGRKVQRYFGTKEQDVLTVPLLVGLDGVHKMSKSLGNYIALTDTPDNMFGKTMSLPDNLMHKYFMLCTALEDSEVGALEKELSPRDLKARLALEIVKLYHGEAKAKKAEENFTKKFTKKDFSGGLLELKVKGGKVAPLVLVIVSKIVKSTSEAWRLVTQGGVSIDGRVVTKPKEMLTFHGGEVVKIGKKNFFRIKI